MKKPFIFLVEDEEDLIGVLQFNLQREGYQVESATTGTAALERLQQAPPPDLVLLDLMLPDLSGLEICRQLRGQTSTRETPVLMLTAKGEEQNRIVGFEAGADDYVVKPFSVRELILRVKALLRRTQSEQEEQIEFGELKVNPDNHQVWVQGVERKLTALEFRLLMTFLTRKGRVQTRTSLLSQVWNVEVAVSTRTVDTHVKRLREKLGVCGDYIETLRGVGYRFRERLDKEPT